MHDHSIILTSDASDVLIDGCVLRNALSTQISGPLTSTTIRDTLGWATESAGTTTVPAAATEVTVNHGLAETPDAGSISVNPVTGWGNATAFWVDSITSTTFKIKLTRGGGTATDVSFRWDADVGAP